MTTWLVCSLLQKMADVLGQDVNYLPCLETMSLVITQEVGWGLVPPIHIRRSVCSYKSRNLSHSRLHSPTLLLPSAASLWEIIIMAKDMTLLWGSGSPPCWRVMIALEEKGLQGYDHKLLSFEKGEHKSQEVLDMNPRGQVRSLHALRFLTIHSDSHIMPICFFFSFFNTEKKKHSWSFLPSNMGALSWTSPMAPACTWRWELGQSA